MNKKLMFGIGALCVVGSIFVACGSGDVSAPSEDEEIAAQIAAQKYADDVEVGTSMDACLKDAACAASLQSPVSSAVTSSATVPSSSSTPIVVSSSSTVVIPVSSSSGISSPVVSSSSVYIPPTSSSSVTSGSSTELTGTCKPKTTPINKGQSAQWVWTRLTPAGTGGIALQGTSTFTWTMPGSTEATATGAGLVTPTATYAASGSYVASVTVGDFTAECSALQVNGAAITGTCTPDVTTADAFKSDVITWTVVASSTGANITGYTWTGATGTAETATVTASAAAVGTTVAPTVSVTNDDNTVQKIPCDGVKVIDSSAPEYELTISGDQISQDTIHVASGGCISVNGTWTNQYYSPTVKVICDLSGDGNLSMSIAYNGVDSDATGSYSISNLAMPIGTLSAGAFSASDICVTYTGSVKDDGKAVCKLGN